MTQNSSPPAHRADLAGSVAARTTLGRYIEIVGGLLLGGLMWFIDAAMHVQLSATAPSLKLFLDELARPGLTPFLFRGSFVALAIGAGWANELKQQYTLGYRPSNRNRDGSFRQIKVETADKSLRVRTKRGYYAARA